MTNRLTPQQQQQHRNSSTIPPEYGLPLSNGISSSQPSSPTTGVRRSSLPASMFPISPTSSPPGSPALRASPLTLAHIHGNGIGTTTPTATTTSGATFGYGISSGLPRSPSASSLTLSHHSRTHSAVLAPLAHSSTFSWPSPITTMGNGSTPPMSPDGVRSTSLVSSSRYIEPTYEDPMRIAFIGPHDSGKTTFIKSFVSGSWMHDCPSLPALLTAKSSETVELKCAFWRTGDGRPGTGSGAPFTGAVGMPSTPSSGGSGGMLGGSIWSDASTRSAARHERLCEIAMIDPARYFKNDHDEANWANQAEGIVFMIHWRQLGQVPTAYFQDYRGQLAAARDKAAQLKLGRTKSKSKSKMNDINSGHDNSDIAGGDGSTIPCIIVVTKCDQFLSADLWAESDAGWLAVLRPSSIERLRSLLVDVTSFTRDICDIIMSCLTIHGVASDTTAKLADARHMAAQIDAGFFITSAKSRMMVFSAISDIATRIEQRRRQTRLHGGTHMNGTAGGGLVTNNDSDHKKCSIQ